jgi:hypothetical protein
VHARSREEFGRQRLRAIESPLARYTQEEVWVYQGEQALEAYFKAFRSPRVRVDWRPAGREYLAPTLTIAVAWNTYRFQSRPLKAFRECLRR